MDEHMQLTALDQFLSLIFQEPTTLADLMVSLGFEQSQVDRLLESHPNPIITQFLSSIHEYLTSDSGKDTYFHLLSRRYGLDGEAPESLETIAKKLALTPEYAGQACQEALDKCRSKTAREKFKKSLRFIIIGQVAVIAGRPPREQVAAKLERLGELRAAADLVHLDYDARRAKIMEKVKAELDGLEAEYTPLFETADENMADLQAEIRNLVLMFGESIRAGTYQAVYTQGRVSWDNEGMDSYARSHPDILEFRKQGQPSVTLRTVADNKP